MDKTVPIGLGTIVGYVSAAVSALLAALSGVQGAEGATKWLTIISAVLVAVTTYGRQAQAK